MNVHLTSNSMRFDIDLMKTFIAVADTGSVKLASERIGRSSAAVSMQMKKLEQLIGSPIFQRTAGKMSMSDVGERLMPHAHRIVQAHDTAVAELQSPKIEGLVRVGLCLENSETRMPEILSRFSKQIVSKDSLFKKLITIFIELNIRNYFFIRIKFNVTHDRAVII